MRSFARRIGWTLAALFLICGASKAWAAPQHGIAMHGSPALPAGFQHFPYVNPHAPKGGALVLSRSGTFSSFNPYNLKGTPAKGLNLVFESLLARSPDEPFTLYGLLAKSVETPPDRSWVEFTLNEDAEFQDGRPVTVEDVVFSFETLRDKGRPNHRAFYSAVKHVETSQPGKIRFVFGDTGDRELPLIMGLMPILPKTHYAGNAFENAGLKKPVGSGPYRVADFEPGRAIVYERNPDYWGADLPVNRGRHNFDRIRYDYYRDRNVEFEAFKKGLIDLWFEDSPSRWREQYGITAVQDGRIKKLELTHGRAVGMYGLAINTRRLLFQDPRVRRALVLAFDFEWANRVFYHNAYRRMVSFFDNSELAGQGPLSEREAELLAAYKPRLDPEILAHGYRPPTTNGTSNNRGNLLKAASLLQDSGWSIEDLALQQETDGAIFTFEILVRHREDQRLALAYKHWLDRLGIQVAIRLVDTPQYIERIENYDFDMIINRWGASLSPGHEQAFYWGSHGVEQPGTRNYPGIHDPAVDALIERITVAETREDLVAAVRALDRVLLSGDYVVPLYYLPYDAIAHWNHLQRPPTTPLYGTQFDSWWADESPGQSIQ